MEGNSYSLKLQAKKLNLYKNCTPLRILPLKFTTL